MPKKEWINKNAQRLVQEFPSWITQASQNGTGPNVHPLVTAYVKVGGKILLSHKRNVLTCTTTWMKLEHMILNVRNHINDHMLYKSIYMKSL